MICPICSGANVFSFQLIGSIEYFRCKTCLGLFTDPESRLSPQEEKERYSLHNNDVEDPEYRKFLSKLYDLLQFGHTKICSSKVERSLLKLIVCEELLEGSLFFKNGELTEYIIQVYFDYLCMNWIYI